MPRHPRRQFLRSTTMSAGAFALGLKTSGADPSPPRFTLQTFSTDVTPPIGHALMGGGIAPARRIADPLFARGLVLSDGGRPFVVVSVEWCEIRNEAFERWRTVLADVAGTDPERVFVSSMHVHDAPIADLQAQRLLESRKAAGSICDLQFHEEAVQRVARALRDGARSKRTITHVGTGQAKVEQVGSNRRYLLPDGKPTFGRTSATRNVLAHEAPEGTIDPWLKTLSFWVGDEPVAALHCYATHPMSHYGQGNVSSDFVGLARQRRQQELPKVVQLYASGCSGNVTAGKYNDGAPANRPVLAERISSAMEQAWRATQRHRLNQIRFHNVKLRLEPRNSPGFSVADLERRLANDPKPFNQCLAALGLSWRKRVEARPELDLPMLDFGPAQLLLLPAESYVEFQLFAQEQRPDSFVVTLGYGECAPGYVPTERAWDEGDSNLGDWCWVAPGAERAMKKAIQTVLAKPA